MHVCYIVLSDTLSEGTTVLGLLVLLGFNLMYALVATVVIALEVYISVHLFPSDHHDSFVTMQPVAGGSGVPEIKSYLNGIKVRPSGNDST